MVPRYEDQGPWKDELHLVPTREQYNFSPELHERLATVLEFEDYRTLCDETDFFRKLGVMGPLGYERAIEDPRTSFLEFRGERIPLLTPIEYEARYNPDTSARMSGVAEADAMLLAVPFREVENLIHEGATVEVGAALGDDFSIVVEDYTGEVKTPEGQTKLKEALGVLGPLEYGEFIDERLTYKPENQPAWMAIYDFVMESQRPEDEILTEGTPEERTIQAWEQYRMEHGLPELPDETFSGPFFLSAEQLTANPHITDKLWDISKIGFGQVLGEQHPISMAVTREFFDRHISTPGTFVCIQYKEGEPQCFGFVAPSMNHNEWLNEESTELDRLSNNGRTKDERVQERRIDGEIAPEDKEVIVHFFELISSVTGARSADKLLTLLQDIASRINKKTRVTFESTGMSDLVVPGLSERTADANPLVELTQRVVKRGTLHYSFLKSKKVDSL